jgi:peptidoglycan L-alanyl-D-glutamate endopeptidase CwlK
MSSFGTRSTERLLTCDPKIQRVLYEAIKHYDFSVVWGHRGQKAQDKAFALGHSKLKWPNSNHNGMPSRAVDVVPYPDGFKNDDTEFYVMATYILAAAAQEGVKLKWGGHWKSFRDLAHFELDRE